MKKGILLAPFILLSLCSCSSDEMNQEYCYVFDSYADLRLFGCQKEDMDDIEDELKHLSKLLDPYQTYTGMNNLAAINKTNETMTVESDLSEFLNLVFDVSSQSDGYLNPMIGSLSLLWKNDLEEGKIPSQEEIDLGLEEMHSSSCVIEGNEVTRSGKAIIDSGAFAKGFALKKIKAMLEEKNIHKYLISLGGSSILVGEKNDSGKEFRINLRDMDNVAFSLKNTAIGVSSIFQQKYEIDGKTYSHVISPKTGYPDIQSSLVFISGNDPFLLDCYSTMFMLKGTSDVEEYEKNGYRFLFSDGNKITYQSPGLEVEG